MLRRSLWICYSFIGSEVCETIAAQAIAIAARNFLACRGSKTDFFAPATYNHRAAQKFLAAGLADFRFAQFRGGWPRARGHH